MTPKDQGIEESIIFEEIKSSLNGFARVIYFKVDTVPKKNLYVTSVKEGRMKNGMFDGFAREFEAIEIESKKEKTA